MEQEWRQALPANGDRSSWTDQQASLIEAMGLVHVNKQGVKTLAPRPVVEAFLYTCRRTGLDPLARQIYCIARWDGPSQSLKWTTQTSIDGFRVIAERHGKYAGQGDVEWLTEQGHWVDAFIPSVHGDHPLAARATIYRHDFLHPLRAIAEWTAYVQTTTYDGKTQPNSMWRRMGPGQLAKCAEALGLRKGFPQDLAGLYTGDEMGQADAAAEEPPLQLSAGQTQEQPAAQPSATVQTQPGTRAVDLDEQTSWWDLARTVRHKGVKGSGDGGARDVFERMRLAGVLSWPIGPGEEQTFREFMRDLSTKVPDQLPDDGMVNIPPMSVEPNTGEVMEPEEDQPMALVPASTAPRTELIPEPQPPAPAAHRVPDEADQEVQQWTPPAEDDASGWTQPGEEETPF